MRYKNQKIFSLLTICRLIVNSATIGITKYIPMFNKIIPIP